MLRRARMPHSSVPGWQERTRPWTEEPDLYGSREPHRPQGRSPERYRRLRSRPLETEFDRYGPSGFDERRRQLSPSPAPTSRAYRRPRSRAATNDDIRYRGYYRGDKEMDRTMEREIEMEREREIERARERERRQIEASRERKRREKEYERGRRGGSSGGGGGRRRSRASRLWDGLEKLFEW
ncbi:hypothetical protein NCU01876 [Neurospora crassa OR74A]|uniref:Uncharacterized protein n=2 Tax=Neurospora crassa TaxID=5141 RepID=Q7SHD0_NEUCR|nr:hypothetical protein NCU01876 [Neurospora crassa OR74A]EAA36271.1 hypothetical protein NCU01876 [Neurospora crassa OR74A]CAE81976.1 hypothetical protein [Neurospora crassa]|eukprot:XP_965507.1 hypothetical protein NCU01876 [Neurospora crassa OR74A]